MGQDRQQPILFNFRLGARRHTHHQTLTWSVDVRIQQAYPLTFGGQRQGKIGRYSRLTHSAFSRCNCNYALHARNTDLTYR